MSVRRLCHLFLLSVAVNGQVLTTYFVQPPGKGATQDYRENPTFSLGSNLDIKWVTFMESYSIYLWQQNLTADAATLGLPIFTKSLSQDEPGTSTWVVSNQDFDLRLSNVFFLAIGPNQTLTGAQTCHYFNVTAAVAKTTSRTLSATTTASSSSSTKEPAATTTESSPSPSQTLKTDATNSSTKLALGLGVGLGVPIILLLAGYFGWRILRAYRNPTSNTRGTNPHSGPPPAWSPRLETSAYNKTELPVPYRSTPSKGQWPSEQIYHELSAGR